MGLRGFSFFLAPSLFLPKKTHTHTKGLLIDSLNSFSLILFAEAQFVFFFLQYLVLDMPERANELQALQCYDVKM